MDAILSEKSKKLVGMLLLEPQIKATVFEKLDHIDKYKMYTIMDNGDVVLGETKVQWWNKLIGCQRTVSFVDFALKVWEALVNLSTGVNQTAIIEGLSREIVMKAVKEKSYDWVVERLYDVATKVAQKSKITDGVGADPEGSRVQGPRLNAERNYPENLVININGSKKKVLSFKDCIGDPLIEIEYGIVGAKRVYP